MKRRELIRYIALLTGTAVIGGDLFLSGCKQREGEGVGDFSKESVDFFDEVAETIIPRTNTPGAHDAGVGKFIEHYSTDCYDDVDLKAVKGAREKIDAFSKNLVHKSFLDASPAEREQVLTGIDGEAKEYEMPFKETKHSSHYFTLIKQMVLLGFFTSKPGATQVLHYVPVPGKYEGCIEYVKGTTSWA